MFWCFLSGSNAPGAPEESKLEWYILLVFAKSLIFICFSSLVIYTIYRLHDYCAG